jgi:hypothetical protein
VVIKTDRRAEFHARNACIVDGSVGIAVGEETSTIVIMATGNASVVITDEMVDT